MLKNSLSNMVQYKKKRGLNWRHEDKALLQQLVLEKVDIIENKKNDANTNQRKIKAWLSIIETFNANALSPRNITQLRSQWNIMKYYAKKENPDLLWSNPQSGDQPGPSQDNQKSLDNILMRLPKQNEINGDSKREAEKSNQATVAPSVFLEDENVSETDEVCSVSTITDDEIKECLKYKRKHSNLENKFEKFETTATATNRANFEIMYRAELHKTQIENEKKKARNLDMEHKILLEQLKYYRKKNEML